LERTLTALVEAARAAWPSVELAPEAFVKHLAERLASTDGSLALENLRATDLYLACACCHGDPVAIREFEKHHMPAVSDFIARRNPSRDVADEVRQILRQRLLVAKEDAPPKICSYTGAGPLGAWLRVTAVRTAQNLLAKRKDLPMEAGPPLRSPDP